MANSPVSHSGSCVGIGRHGNGFKAYLELWVPLWGKVTGPAAELGDNTSFLQEMNFISIRREIGHLSRYFINSLPLNVFG